MPGHEYIFIPSCLALLSHPKKCIMAPPSPPSSIINHHPKACPLPDSTNPNKQRTFNCLHYRRFPPPPFSSATAHIGLSAHNSFPPLPHFIPETSRRHASQARARSPSPGVAEPLQYRLHHRHLAREPHRRHRARHVRCKFLRHARALR